MLAVTTIMLVSGASAWCHFEYIKSWEESLPGPLVPICTMPDPTVRCDPSFPCMDDTSAAQCRRAYAECGDAVMIGESCPHVFTCPIPDGEMLTLDDVQKIKDTCQGAVDDIKTAKDSAKANAVPDSDCYDGWPCHDTLGCKGGSEYVSRCPVSCGICPSGATVDNDDVLKALADGVRALESATECYDLLNDTCGNLSEYESILGENVDLVDLFTGFANLTEIENRAGCGFEFGALADTASGLRRLSFPENSTEAVELMPECVPCVEGCELEFEGMEQSSKAWKKCIYDCAEPDINPFGMGGYRQEHLCTPGELVEFEMTLEELGKSPMERNSSRDHFADVGSEECETCRERCYKETQYNYFCREVNSRTGICQSEDRPRECNFCNPNAKEHSVCEVTLFEDDDFIGDSVTYQVEGEVGDLSLVWGNDEIRSIEVVGYGCTATFYEHKNYKGWSVTLSKGSYTLIQLQVWGFENNYVKSMKMTNTEVSHPDLVETVRKSEEEDFATCLRCCAGMETLGEDRCQDLFPLVVPPYEPYHYEGPYINIGMVIATIGAGLGVCCLCTILCFLAGRSSKNMTNTTSTPEPVQV